MIDWADWYVAIKMLWYDFDLMGLEYRFISYYSHGLIVCWCCLQEVLDIIC